MEAAWWLLRRYDVDTNVLCTVHAANAAHPLEVYRYFRDVLGATWVQLIPIVERVPEHLAAVAEDRWRGPDGRRVLYRQVGDQQLVLPPRPNRVAHPRGQEVLHRLAATADGLMGNLRGDQPDVLGLTYKDLCKNAIPRSSVRTCRPTAATARARAGPATTT